MNSKERHEIRYQRRKAKREKRNEERAARYTQWDNVFGLIPLLRAYKSVATKSRGHAATQIFMANLLVNARTEERKLRAGTWKTRGFNHFTIIERGKKRDIKSVHISEKGIQNTFCNNCLIPILRPHLIYDNGASLKGKGTDFALNRFTKHLQEFTRKHGRNGYIYFYDFSGYFANIPITPLSTEVGKKVMDGRMREMFNTFVNAFGEIGLGLGSQVSQISAVFYPNGIDHLIKDRCGMRYYGRYMDDGYIICHDLKRLKKVVTLFEKECDRSGIILNKKKCQFIKLTKNFVFLKTRFFITNTGKVAKRINRQTSRKERQRLKAYRRFYDMGIMTYEEIYMNFHSWLLSLKRGRSFNVKLNAIKYFNGLFPEFPPYRPPKKKNRRTKQLCYIAKLAQGG